MLPFEKKRENFPERDLRSHQGLQFSRSVVSNSLRPHEPQHARPPCPSPTPGVHPNPRPLIRRCHPTTSSSVVPFSRLQSLPASGSFPAGQFFASGGQSVGASASASVLPLAAFKGSLRFPGHARCPHSHRSAPPESVLLWACSLQGSPVAPEPHFFGWKVLVLLSLRSSPLLPKLHRTGWFSGQMARGKKKKARFPPPQILWDTGANIPVPQREVGFFLGILGASPHG